MIDKEFKKFRYEKKSVLFGLSKHWVEGLIKCHPSIFSETFQERRVNSIYFDSLEFKNYYDHIDGFGERLKIRIRWYGKIFGEIKNPVLEIKMKWGEVGEKKSFPLNSFLLDRGFSNKSFQKEVISKSNLPKWIKETFKALSPTLLNSYKRKYFISADKNYRITLDTGLLFFRMKSKENLFNERIVDEERIIFELKYSSGEEKANFITQYFPFRFMASSKYIEGMNIIYTS